MTEDWAEAMAAFMTAANQLSFSRTEPHERSRAMSMTMEQLQAQPSGTGVSVRGVEWQKVDNGLMRDGVVLGFQHFTGYLNEGLIETHEAWPVGRWYVNASTYRLIVRKDNGIVHALGWARSGVRPEERTWPESTRPGSWQLVPTVQEDIWMRRTAALHQHMLSTTTFIPPNVVSALQAYGNEENDQAFDDLLVELGIGRPTTEHVSTVTITGTSTWVPSRDMAKGWLGEGFVVNSVEEWANVSWTRVVSITRQGRGCTCNDIDEDAVQPFLPSECADWDYETECAVQSN